MLNEFRFENNYTKSTRLSLKVTENESSFSFEDFRKVSVAQRGAVDAFSSEMIKKCIDKIQTIALH